MKDFKWICRVLVFVPLIVFTYTFASAYAAALAVLIAEVGGIAAVNALGVFSLALAFAALTVLLVTRE